MRKYSHGRYHDLVLALVRHSNSVNRVLNTETNIGGFGLTVQEYQLLEAVAEYEDENWIMSDYASHLGISLSSISKMASKLTSLGLITKYKLSTNKKNIILKPTDTGIELYHRFFSDISGKLFAPFYAKLDTIPEEYLERMTEAINVFSGELKDDAEERLIEVVRVIK